MTDRTSISSTSLAAALLVVLLAAGAPALAQLACGPFVDGGTDELNGEFMYGISYFGAIAETTENVGEDLEFSGRGASTTSASGPTGPTTVRPVLRC